ncbi:MAG: hypothetical protein VX936_13645, partial [Planctomycetota bacterium]|nr:hypothetical protein [Planctomycetota bacterium]
REIRGGKIGVVDQLPPTRHTDSPHRLTPATLNSDSQQRHGGLLIFDLRVILSTMSPSEKASGPNLFDGLANSFLQRYR